MRQAFDLGCTFFDTAESYAAGENERLVGRALAPIRDHVVIATKFRFGDSASGAEVGRQIRAPLEASLTRLGTEYVELYYQHRVSPSVPVEDVAAVIELTEEEFGRIEAGLAKIEIHGNRTDEDVAKLRDLQ
jgi:aryl-alcohol dehydrogenase-like predicted oxidoreductase